MELKFEVSLGHLQVKAGKIVLLCTYQCELKIVLRLFKVSVQGQPKIGKHHPEKNCIRIDIHTSGNTLHIAVNFDVSRQIIYRLFKIFETVSALQCSLLLHLNQIGNLHLINFEKKQTFRVFLFLKFVMATLFVYVAAHITCQCIRQVKRHNYVYFSIKILLDVGGGGSAPLHYRT